MVAGTIRDERLALVAMLRPLDAADWARPTPCAGWTVAHVVAHLVTPFLVSRGAMALQVMRERGIDQAFDAAARRIAERPPGELLDVLEANAASTFRPPGMPLTAPLADTIAHSADIRWALGEGCADWGPPARLAPALDFLVSPRAAVAFVPRGRLRGLRLVADDQDWQHGQGREVRGPSLALALTVLGRRVAADQLEGDGAPLLAG